MADVINLRQARKEKARRARDGEAAANRTRFGRTKAEKVADKDADERSRRALESKRLEPEKP
ncbi:MAG: DUF4169 family protein [Alphaproteobacteria bacterium]|nr:DUF4169 family protein [Alphaproteobacteria bacterium]